MYLCSRNSRWAWEPMPAPLCKACDPWISCPHGNKLEAEPLSIKGLFWESSASTPFHDFLPWMANCFDPYLSLLDGSQVPAYQPYYACELQLFVVMGMELVSLSNEHILALRTGWEREWEMKCLLYIAAEEVLCASVIVVLIDIVK